MGMQGTLLITHAAFWQETATSGELQQANHTSSAHNGGLNNKTSVKTRAADLVVLFALIGRDAGGHLPVVLRNIERLGRRFHRAHVVLVENDSVDNTVAVFSDWAANYTRQRSSTKTKVISFSAGGLGKKNLNALAMARNRYIDALIQHFPRADYLIPVGSVSLSQMKEALPLGVLGMLTLLTGGHRHVQAVGGRQDCKSDRQPAAVQRH